MKKIYIISLFVLGSCFISCEGFLEETPYNKVTQGNYYTSYEGITGGINGLYARLKEYYGQEFFMNVCEAETDITIWPQTPGRPPVMASTGYVSSLWNILYINLNQCNEVIYSLENFDIPGLSESLRSRYLGESRFLRAHTLDHLVKQWGDIHMELTPTSGIVTTAKRVPAEQVWEQIIADLEFAVENLPETYTASSDYGRITSYAAMHMLSKVLLTSHRSDKNALQRAQKLAEDIINSGHYSLFPSTYGLWEMANVRNSEVIFPVVFADDPLVNGIGNRNHSFFVADYTQHKGFTRSVNYGMPWIRCKTTRYGYELYQNPGIDTWSNNRIADKRAKDWFQIEWKINIGKSYTETLFNPHTLKDETVTFNQGELAMIACPWFNSEESIDFIKKMWPVWVWIPDHMEATIKAQGGIQSESNPSGIWPSNTAISKVLMFTYLRKHLDPTRSNPNYQPGHRDVFVYRLAETYLLAAEAAFLLGDKKVAADHINVVRKRAERTEPEFVDKLMISADQVTEDFILDERGRELIGEMHYRYDLLRFGKLQERMLKNKDKIWYFTPAYEFEEHFEKRPYPRDFLLSIDNPEDFPNDSRYGS